MNENGFYVIYGPTLGPMSGEFLARRVGEHADEHAAQITAAAR